MWKPLAATLEPAERLNPLVPQGMVTRSVPVADRRTGHIRSFSLWGSRVPQARCRLALTWRDVAAAPGDGTDELITGERLAAACTARGVDERPPRARLR